MSRLLVEIWTLRNTARDISEVTRNMLFLLEKGESLLHSEESLVKLCELVNDKFEWNSQEDFKQSVEYIAFLNSCCLQ